MPINLTMNVSLPGGATINVSDSLDVAAYDRIDEQVPHGGTVGLNLHPRVAGTLRFLAISSNAYGKELTYQVNEKSGKALLLDRPHIFSGPAALLVEDPLHRLYFSNGLDQDADISILVGREAAEPEDTAAPPAPAADIEPERKGGEGDRPARPDRTWSVRRERSEEGEQDQD
jgi:hypothetical protein